MWRREDIEMTEVQVFGEKFMVPKMFVDDYVRLRALERRFSDEENERLLRAWEAEHGPLPAPPSEPYWVPVERNRYAEEEEK